MADTQSANGHVIWITGLSGSGKSTLARLVADYVADAYARPIILDGDDLRSAIADTNCAHDLASRLANAYRICRFAKMFAEQGHIVIVATMSLFHEIHGWNRRNLPGYREVFLDVKLETLKARDPKGLYKNVMAGAQKNLPGIDIQAELPATPDLTLGDAIKMESPEAQAQRIFSFWEARMQQPWPDRQFCPKFA